ncbi:MAG: tyrosine-type recombinase/integrase [Anaerolineaceae bacterium]|nr:tyrosine-type recombinase/integrase [Anaerolineaceae bacterium]
MANFNSVQTIIPESEVKSDLVNWMEGFIMERKSRQTSPNTLKYYGVEFRRFVKFCAENGITSVESLTADNLRRYLVHLEQTGRNTGGIHASYRAIRSFLLWYENEVESDNWRNPIRKVKAPKLNIQPLEPVSYSAVKKMIAACDRSGDNLLAKRDKAMFSFLLDTGARAFEVCAMDVADLNTQTGEVIIRKGKGGKPRIALIGKTTRRLVRAYLRDRREKSAALWASESGERLTYWGLNQMIRRRAAQARIKKPGLHDFRRAFALNCLRNGMDVFTLQRLMGHADLQVLRRYLAQTDDDLRLAHAKASPVDNARL